MSESRRSGRTVWVALVIVAALVAAPVGAVAAISSVHVVGGSGTTAQVDGANQLLTTESSPKTYVLRGYFQVTTGGGCVTFVTPPANRAFILKQIVVRVKTSPSFDASHVVLFAAEASCNGAFVFEDQPSHLGTEVFDFDPGMPIPSTGRVTVEAVGSGLSAEIAVSGYTVPAAAV
jgi:hypothetical protein